MRTLLILSLFTSAVFAEKPDLATYSTALDFAQVTDVLATQKSDGSWCFGTSVRHNDQGWDHYADGWQVLDPDGNQIDFRLLGHPHDNEQPFTRSKCNISVPSELSKVIVRAKCNKHGYGGKPFVVNLRSR
tara:strand:- start:43 stop:435 length:393 start_codon:yes stop_codon:yes gene_type:complete